MSSRSSISLSRLSGGELQALRCSRSGKSLSRLSGGERKFRECYREFLKSLSRLSGGEPQREAQRKRHMSLSRLSGGERRPSRRSLQGFSQPPIRRGTQSAAAFCSSREISQPPIRRGTYRPAINSLHSQVLSAAYPAGNVVHSWRCQACRSLSRLSGGERSRAWRFARLREFSQPPIRRGTAILRLGHPEQDLSAAYPAGNGN